MENNKRGKFEGRDWSELNFDILGLIASKLVSLFDISSFKEVCSSWSVAVQRRNKKPFSLLVFFEDSNEIITRKSKRLNENPKKDVLPRDQVLYLSINEKKPCEVLKMPCTFPHIIQRHKMIGSNPEGWLIMFMLDRNKHPYVTKLFSTIRIQLPTEMICGRHLAECYHERINITEAKLCLCGDADNPSHLVVIMLYSQYGTVRVGIWRTGDRHWTCLKGKNYIDIAFCGNESYALLSDNKQCVYIESLDFGTSSCLPGKRSRIAEPNLMYRDCRWNEYGQRDHWLVSSSANEMLIVKSEGHKFSIWKLNLSEERCVPVDSLTGNTLILGAVTSAFVLSNNAEDYGYNRNSVYLVGYYNIWGNCNISICRSYGLENGKGEYIWKSNISGNTRQHFFGLIHLYC